MIGNKVRGSKDEDYIRKNLPDADILGFLPYDEALIEADLAGRSVPADFSARMVELFQTFE